MSDPYKSIEYLDLYEDYKKWAAKVHQKPQLISLDCKDCKSYICEGTNCPIYFSRRKVTQTLEIDSNGKVISNDLFDDDEWEKMFGNGPM